MSTKKNGDILYAEDFNAKQDLLVSGTNIKTINGNSILGSGNIVVEGGGASVSIDNDTETAVLSTGSADTPTTQGISFKGTTPSGTKIPIPIFDVPAIKSPSNKSLTLSSDSDIPVNTTNYSISWDTASQAIKIVFN